MPLYFPQKSFLTFFNLDTSVFPQLSAPSCQCRAKTALVTNTELSHAHLAAIDQSGFGAHCLQSVTKNLGLPIHGNFHLSSAGSFDKSEPPTTFLTRCAKQLDKLKARLSRVPKGAHSIRVRIIFFNTYCLSLFYYAQSVHCFSKKELQPLYSAMSDFILQRRWFPSHLLPGLMRWLKIGPLLDPHLMHAVSLLGFFHRKGGTSNDPSSSN